MCIYGQSMRFSTPKLLATTLSLLVEKKPSIGGESSMKMIRCIYADASINHELLYCYCMGSIGSLLSSHLRTNSLHARIFHMLKYLCLFVIYDGISVCCLFWDEYGKQLSVYFSPISAIATYTCITGKFPPILINIKFIVILTRGYTQHLSGRNRTTAKCVWW